MRISATIQKRIFVVLLAGFFIWLLCVIFHPLEPRYGGKRLSQWAAVDSDWQNTPQKYERARNAIQHIGTRALPYAIEWCRAAYPVHFIPVKDLHERSIEVFSALGPAAKPAIPTLIQLLNSKDKGVVNTAMGDLSDIGPDAVAPLAAALTDSSAQVRGCAASLLGLWPTAKSAVPALALCLEDRDRTVRMSAAITLARLGSNSPAIVVPALLDALERETNSLHTTGVLTCMGALASFGTNAKAAVPVLINILESQPATNGLSLARRGAIFALKKIDPESAKPYFEEWKASLTNGNGSFGKAP